jgi:hypothetical protein
MGLGVTGTFSTLLFALLQVRVDIHDFFLLTKLKKAYWI